MIARAATLQRAHMEHIEATITVSKHTHTHTLIALYRPTLWPYHSHTITQFTQYIQHNTYNTTHTHTHTHHTTHIYQLNLLEH